MIKRRPFLKTLLASISAWFLAKIAMSEALSTGSKPVLFTFYTPCRVWISPKCPSLTPKSAKHWLDSTTGNVFHYKGQDLGWVQIPEIEGCEVSIGGKEVGYFAEAPISTDTWISELPKLKESECIDKCEGCGDEHDLRDNLFDSVLLEFDNGKHFQYYRLCQACANNARLTYEL